MRFHFTAWRLYVCARVMRVGGSLHKFHTLPSKLLVAVFTSDGKLVSSPEPKAEFSLTAPGTAEKSRFGRLQIASFHPDENHKKTTRTYIFMEWCKKS
jgi:hypothetical protein